MWMTRLTQFYYRSLTVTVLACHTITFLCGAFRHFKVWGVVIRGTGPLLGQQHQPGLSWPLASSGLSSELSSVTFLGVIWLTWLYKYFQAIQSAVHGLCQALVHWLFTHSHISQSSDYNLAQSLVPFACCQFCLFTYDYSRFSCLTRILHIHFISRHSAGTVTGHETKIISYFYSFNKTK